MKLSELISLFEMLNKEDNKIISQLRNKVGKKFMFRAILYSIIMVSALFLIANYIENFVIAIIVALGLLFLFFTYMFLVLMPKLQYTLWEGFFEVKSIIYNTRDYNGFISALNDYISRDKNYYTDEKSIDRRAVET